jgi:3-oxoacyl-[acyl-carrier protein] reductase
VDFSGKFVLVTGGSRGIGKAVAEGFSKRGARVAIGYKSNRQAAEETLHSLTDGSHILIQADVSKSESAQNLVDTTISQFGKIDIVVNNAGISKHCSIDEVDFTEWQKAWYETIGINLIGPANVTYCAVQYFIKQGGGRIVNVSSRGAFRGEPENPAYGASKAGLNAMSQSLAQKLAKHNIFVGVVAPGFVETDMAAKILASPKGDEIRNQSPFGRVARPEEVAYAVLFLASEGSEFSTGTIIDVNGASYLRS